MRSSSVPVAAANIVTVDGQAFAAQIQGQCGKRQSILKSGFEIVPQLADCEFEAVLTRAPDSVEPIALNMLVARAIESAERSAIPPHLRIAKRQ